MFVTFMEAYTEVRRDGGSVADALAVAWAVRRYNETVLPAQRAYAAAIGTPAVDDAGAQLSAVTEAATEAYFHSVPPFYGGYSN